MGDVWIMKRIISSSKRLIDLQGDAALISKTWHGEPDIANYTIIGPKQSNSEESSPDLMFDDENNTFWSPRRPDLMKIVVRFNVSFP